MRRSIAAVVCAVALASAVAFSSCTVEELEYSPSVPADGSVGGTGGGAGDSGVGGTPAWAEVCGNGIDDDLDGKTDCEDPACESYACVAAPPSGWTGPVVLYEGAPGSLAQCPTGLASVFEGHADVTYEKASCGSCSCGDPLSTSCLVGLNYYSDSACTSLVATDPPSATGICDPTVATTVGSIQITSFTPSGTCGAGTPATPSLSPPSWGKDARACALSDGKGTAAGCAAGEVCSPLSSEGLACVLQTGDLDCPGGYSDRHVFYSDFADSRACGSCSCAYSAGSCSNTVSFYSDTGCSSLLFTRSTTGCGAGAVYAAKASTSTTSTGSCTPSGAQSTGCVLPEEPTTVCCKGSEAPCPSGGGPKMVRLSTPTGSYCIDSTEVTRGQYQAFLTAAPAPTSQPEFCSWNTSFTPQQWTPTPQDEPVEQVDWCDAYAFCAWAGKRLCGKIGGGSTAQTELTNASASQWFNACSAGGTKSYPYGDSLADGACAIGTLAPVQSYPCCGGGYPGLFDMVGNAEEWEDSCTGGGSGNDSCAVRGEQTCSAAKQRPRAQRIQRLGFRCCS